MNSDNRTSKMVSVIDELIENYELDLVSGDEGCSQETLDEARAVRRQVARILDLLEDALFGLNDGADGEAELECRHCGITSISHYREGGHDPELLCGRIAAFLVTQGRGQS